MIDMNKLFLSMIRVVSFEKSSVTIHHRDTLTVEISGRNAEKINQEVNHHLGSFLNLVPEAGIPFKLVSFTHSLFSLPVEEGSPKKKSPKRVRKCIPRKKGLASKKVGK